MFGMTSDDVVVSSEGKDLVAQQSFSERFSDRAFNRVAASLGGISIDKTPPSISCFAIPFTLWPPNHQLIPVTVGLFFFDGDEYSTPFSGGPANGMPLLSVVSSVPRDGDIVGWDIGTEDTSGQLLAWRAKDLPTYTFMYEGSDFAGNSSTCTTQVSVGRN